MQQQVYTEEYLKVRDEVNHARKIMWLTFGGVFLGMLVLAVIKSRLWDNVAIDLIAYSFAIPSFYVLYRWVKADVTLEKMLPKKDYLQIQTNDKQFKKVKWIFGIFGIASGIVAFGVLITNFLYENQWIQFHVINYELVILMSLLSLMGNLGALQFVFALREQYLKVKEKERE